MSATPQAVDRRVILYTMLLLGVGLVMVYGASSYELLKLQLPTTFYLSAHLERIGIALAVGALAALVPYRISARLAVWGFWCGVVLLAATVVGLGISRSKVATDIPRWLSILGYSVQPVEICKLCLALALPWWIDRHPKRLESFREGVVRLLVPMGVVVVLLALQPNYGSALAITLMCLGILWVGGLRVRHLVLLLGGAGAMGWLAILHVEKVRNRIVAWLELLLQERSVGDWGYQQFQAQVALGNGGLHGVGPGASVMKYEFLPEGHTDFIFAILGEELGFLGAAALLLVFGLLLGRIARIASRSQDGLGYLVAVGIGCMLFSYALLNLAVVTGLMPVAGLPLPLLSFGGSALVTNMAGIGVLLNVSRHARRRRSPTERWKGVGG